MGDTKETGSRKKLTDEEKRTRAKVRQAEVKAQVHAEAEAWKAQVSAHFNYLETTYGFRLAQVKAWDPWETTVRYSSSQLAIIVSRNVEFNRVELWLIRLVAGRVPKYPINHILLDRVLSQRAPLEAEQLKALKGLDAEQVESSLVFLASALRTYADDVLQGDLGIFEKKP